MEDRERGHDLDLSVPDPDAHVASDVAGHLGCQPAITRIDSTRLQRAPEGSNQSAAGRGDDIVESGSVRRHEIGIDAVVLGDLGVDTEPDGFIHLR